MWLCHPLLVLRSMSTNWKQRKSLHKDEVAIEGFIKGLENLEGNYCSVINLYPIYTSVISLLKFGVCFKPVVLLTGFKYVYTTCLNKLP